MLTLILGGVRSGKSRHAAELARRRPGRAVYFLATARPRDPEMRRRILAHRKSRPQLWKTVEECRKVPERLGRIPAGSTVILDCATLWVARLLMDRWGAERILESARKLALAARRRLNLIVVSNEVGSGVIPPSPLGRKYQDVLGEVNALLAGEAERVVLMTAGIARRIK